MTEWAFDRLYDSLVRELVEARAHDAERASSARRGMADLKEEERSVGQDLERRADEDRATFREMLEDAKDKSGGQDLELSYDSADEDQERQAELIARYLVSLGYAEMRSEQAAAGRTVYRVRILWDRLRRWQEPGE